LEIYNYLFASGGVDEADIAYLPHTDILKNNTTNLSNDSLVTSGVKPMTSCGHAWELQASWINQRENKHIVKNLCISLAFGSCTIVEL